MPPLPATVPEPDDSITLVHLATLPGKGRKAAFRRCGFDAANDLVMLRALQHLTSLHGTEWLELGPFEVHGHLSANHWGPVASSWGPLFGHPLCLSQEARLELTHSAQALEASSASHGCVGLLNQGSTCYLNSLLQTLFHLPEFRRVIYCMPTTADVQDAKSVPFALQRLFCLLETSDAALSTKHLTTSFGWSSNEAFVQHDIHELTRILLDNLEEKLVRNGMENGIKRLFCGVQENYINVPDAGYCGVREEPFYDLQLVVKDISDIYKSFDAFVQPEILDGRNKYCLERGGEKSYHCAEKGIRFRQFPPVIILHLARFDFDPFKGEMCKVFSRWDFFEQLNLARYLPAGTSAELSEYALHSVLVHSGSDAKFGHYYCFVKVGSVWLKFNDELVAEAEPSSVFGANFGGSQMSYWGTETPLSTNAYMLVYVRKSLLSTLMRPLGPEELPPHLVAHLQREKETELRKLEEMAQDHLFAKVHVVTVDDIKANTSILSQHCPRIKHDAQRTLRLHLSDSVIPACSASLESMLGIPAEDQLMWHSEPRVASPSTYRLQSLVTREKAVKMLCRDGEYATLKECCLLVLDAKTVPRLGNAFEQPTLLTHHKLYDPHKLSVTYLGPVLLHGCIEHIKEAQTTVMNLLPPEARPASSAVFTVALEEGSSPAPATHPASGDIYVWQEQMSPMAAEDVLYPTFERFQHFLRNKIPVVLHAMAPPHELVASTELAWDMTHHQLQKYVAKLAGVANADKIRFARHNPETKQPFFAKVKSDTVNLRGILLNSNHDMFRQLYFEVCPFTLAEIEGSNSLQFEYFSDAVRSVSSHWILIPKGDGVMRIRDVLQRCLIDIRETSRSPKKDNEQQDSVDALEARDLRLVDVWKGRIYNAYDEEEELPTSHFEESSEYRVERRPQRLTEVDCTRQMLLCICHFSRGVGHVNCHGDPFSMWIDVEWDFEELRQRINKKLNLSEQATMDWKPCLCRVNTVAELVHDQPLGPQLLAFADRSLYRTNLKEPKQTAFLGLEHSPLPHARRPARREERSLKIYN